MASFLCIIDPDRDRRQRVLNAATAAVAFLPHLERRTIVSAHFSLVWALPPATPWSHHRGPAGEAVVLGCPHAGDTGRPVDAAALAARYGADRRAAPHADGFHGAFFAEGDGAMRFEADVLGAFPIYYWQRGDIVLVASSPQAFGDHPVFSAALDFHGLAALLLTSGLAGGRTLLAGVRRLAADHALVHTPGGALAERRFAAADPLPTDPADAVDRIHELITRHVGGALAGARRPGLLLSGGLDSRLLAGYLDAADIHPQALTFGRDSDLEANCARQVAEALDLSQTVADIDPASYPSYVRASVATEHLAGGLYAIPMGWNLAFQSPRLPSHDRLVCGLMLDAVTGGAKEVPARGPDPLTFEDLRVAKLGFAPHELQGLVRHPELHQALDEVRGELVRVFEQGGEDDIRRTWRMNLCHRQRYAVGVCAWRYALHAWPVLPALDRTLIRVMAGLPSDAAQDRRLQKTLLARHFPRLARLELDRNYFDTAPLIIEESGLTYNLRRRAQRWSRRVESYLGRERRFYVRTMDFDGEGWRTARTATQAPGRLASALFDSDRVRELLPPAGRPARRGDDAIVHSTPLKTLTGVLDWLHQLEHSKPVPAAA